MRKISSVVIALCAAVAVSLSCYPSEARDVGPDNADIRDLFSGMGRMAPKVCEELQNQIDGVVAVSKSSLNETEKIAKLSQVLAQSLAALSGSPEKDADIDPAVKQYTFFIEQLLTSALASAKSGAKDATADTQDELKKLKILTSNYVGMMKLLCPELKLPDAVGKQ